MSEYIGNQALPKLKEKVEAKQDKLVSGTNIKTINGQDVTGAGNIEIEGGGGGVNVLHQYSGPTSDNDVYGADYINTRINNTPVSIGYNVQNQASVGVAVGTNSKTSGMQAVTIGANSNVVGDFSTAVGAHSAASQENSVAIGFGAVTTRAKEVSFGAGGEGGLWAGKRILANVADAELDNDAVNKKQMDAAISSVSENAEDAKTMANAAASSATAAATAASMANDKANEALAKATELSEPVTAEEEVDTKTALDEVDTTGFTGGETYEVKADETQGGKSTIYVWNAETNQWELNGEPSPYVTKDEFNDTIGDLDAILTRINTGAGV